MKKPRRFGRMIACVAVLSCAALTSSAQDYDLVILGGRVMDPETNLDATRNVGVKDGHIQVITSTKITGKQSIDASDHVVAPGFIDLHCHGQDPYAIKIMLRDGVTSPLEIEAGAWPVNVYYEARDGKSQANYGVSVGHVWARIAAMDGVDPKGLGLYSGVINAATHDGAKWSTERADEKQLKEIMAKVEQGLRQGGIGIGLPVGYHTAVSSPELMQVAALAKRYDSFITSHVRYLSQVPPSGMMLMNHIKEREMLEAFVREGVFIGADAMPLSDDQGKIPAWDAAYGVGKGHPRGAGTHAKVLRMVRENQLIPLMDAIAKLSYLQAKFLEHVVPDMKHRGRLKPGSIADITIFDPNTVRENSAWGKGKIQPAFDGHSLRDRQRHGGSERLEGAQKRLPRPTDSQ